MQNRLHRFGTLLLVFAAIVCCAFFVNVLTGASLLGGNGQALFGDVTEMLLLFAVTCFFVAGFIVREAEAKHPGDV